MADMATFHPFTSLPFELRERIWYYTSLAPRIIHVQLDCPWKTLARGAEIVTPPKAAWYWTWENRDRILPRRHPDGRDGPYPWTRREQTLRITSKESKECMERFALVRMLNVLTETPLDAEHDMWLRVRRNRFWADHLNRHARPKIVDDEEFEAQRLADFARWVDFESDVFYLCAYPLEVSFRHLHTHGIGPVAEMPKFMRLLRHVVICLRQADTIAAAELYRQENSIYRTQPLDAHSLFYGLLDTTRNPNLETFTVYLNTPYKNKDHDGRQCISFDEIGHDAARLVNLSFDKLEQRFGGSHRAVQTLAVAARVKAVIPRVQFAVLDGSTRLDRQNRHNGWWLWFFREVLSPDGRVMLSPCRTARECDERDPGRVVLDPESAGEVRKFWASRHATDPPLRPEDYARFNIRCAPLGPKIPYPYAGR